MTERTGGAARSANMREIELERERALTALAGAVRSEPDLDAVLERAVTDTSRVLAADHAFVALASGDERFSIRAEWSADPAKPLTRPNERFPVTTLAFRERRTVAVEDVVTAEELSDPSLGGRQALVDAGALAVLATPILVFGRPIGVFTLDRAEASSWSPAECSLAETVAAQLGLALHAAGLLEERQRQADIQQGFYRIADVLGSPLSLAKTLDALSESAARALGGISGLVLRVTDDLLVLVGSYDLRPELTARLEEGVPAAPVAFFTAARSRVVSSGALADDDRFDENWRALLAGVGCRALLSVPVTGSKGESYAVVVLFGEKRSFSEHDLALASHLSAAAAGALERSALFELEVRARNFSQRLASVGARLVRNLEPAAVREEVVDEARGLVEADAATIRLLEGDELVVRAAAGSAAAGLVGTHASSDTSLLADVAQSRVPLAVEDVRAVGPELVRGDALLETTMTACLAVPMTAHGGGLLGVLTVYSAVPRQWPPDEVQAVLALAAVASAALSTAQLYQRVAEEKERSSAILANIADGIVVVGRDERIVLWNAMAEQITGVPAEEALGRTVVETLQRDLAGGESERPGEREVAVLRGTKEVWLSLTEAVMRDRTGEVVGRIFAFRDVSSERLVDQMKSDFISAVSHELRAPLTSIYGFSETLRRSDVAFGEEAGKTFLRYIAVESERLIEIVDDLLTVAHLEAGTLAVSVTATDVAEVIKDVVARMEERAGGGHRLRVHLPSATLYVDADADRLAQVVLHLLDNAVKFSPGGGAITVSGRRRADTVEVRVADEGVGIAPSEQERIFSKFLRADTAARTGVHGQGLGLFLARGLLAAMDGRIWVESREGKGANFVFELPVSKTAPRGKEEVEAAGRS